MNKTLQDEYFGARLLDAFDLIDKECRKYGLFLCFATQMPRDIPIGTLSQMGTFIVHRLINHYDKEAVSGASSSVNQYVLSFLPILGEGEAILMGIDFPMPLSIRVDEPKEPPDSDTPQFGKTHMGAYKWVRTGRRTGSATKITNKGTPNQAIQQNVSNLPSADRRVQDT